MVFIILGSTVTTRLNVTTTHDSANLTGIQPSRSPQVIISCGDVDAVVKFGGSNVQASNSYSSDDLAAGNIFIAAGSVQTFRIPPDATYVSAICEDASSTGGYIWFTPGTGD